MTKRKYSSEQLLECPKRPKPTLEDIETTPVSPNGDIFSFCPAEIKLQIFNLLEKDEVTNLSRCSRSFYAFSWGLRIKSVILDAKSVLLFQKGGLGEHGCHSIRSVRLGKKRRWSKNAAKLGSYFCGGNFDTNGALDQVRAALSLFPNLQKLSLSYQIPSAAENNAYVAIFNEISRHPKLGSNLEYLEIEAVKIPETDPRGCYQRADELYEKLYSELSVENRKFLGSKVADNEIGRILREKMEVQGFPVLKKAKISANCIAGLMADPRCAYMRKTGFYYIPLLFAPQLRTLNIETTDSFHVFDTYGFTERDNLKGRSKADFEVGLLDVFAKITKLSLTTYNSPKPKDVQRLAQRFPDVRDLKIKMFNNRPCDGYSKNRISYTSIKDMKHLKTLSLPWPRGNGGSFDLAKLQGQIKCWRKAGLNSLERVEFLGKRDKSGGIGRMWSDTHLVFEIRGGSINAREDTQPFQYEDCRKH
ncbi:hypothetical protein TWF481_000023 [Arthrobotrys musiformis]|uniref:F-box domain-containing protein n=1 Tax=Arthrobotrys musiformis TaxID=47236 RepID=A0AAV9WLI2_9PEZI